MKAQTFPFNSHKQNPTEAYSCHQIYRRGFTQRWLVLWIRHSRNFYISPCSQNCAQHRQPEASQLLPFLFLRYQYFYDKYYIESTCVLVIQVVCDGTVMFGYSNLSSLGLQFPLVVQNALRIINTALELPNHSESELWNREYDVFIPSFAARRE